MREIYVLCSVAFLLAVLALILSAASFSKASSKTSAKDFVFDHDLIPTMDKTFDIGSEDYKVKSLYLGSGTVFIGDTGQIGNDPSGLIYTSKGFASPAIRLGATIPGGFLPVHDGADLTFDDSSGRFSYRRIDTNGSQTGLSYSLTTFQDLIPGLQGPQGIQGLQGIIGPQGPAGVGIQVLGTYFNYESFTNGAGSTSAANYGDAWILESDGSLYIYSSASGWVDVGNLQGPQGIQGIQGIPGPQGPPGLSAVSFGSFFSSVSQFMGELQTLSNLSVSTPLHLTSVAYSTADIFCSTTRASLGGGSVSGDSRIFVTNPGLYRISTSIQFDVDNGSQHHKAAFWIRKNGGDIPFSARVITVARENETQGNDEILVSLSSGDYIQSIFQSTASGVFAASFLPTNVNPYVTVSVPSVMTSILRMG